MQATLTGGCLCGAVRYETNGKLHHITHCHCGICRKAHGAAFATYVRLGRRRFRLTRGADSLRSFRSLEHVTREFCGTCGSQISWSNQRHPDAIGIALGTLDGDPGGRPEAHIYAKDRAFWDEIDGPLPQFDAEVPIEGSSTR